MKVAIYPRVSSLKQVKEGDSIDSQIERLRQFCKDNDFEIVKTYRDDGKSATINEDKIKLSIVGNRLVAKFNLNKRPAFKEMLKDCEKGLFDGLVFFKWDRFSRNAVFSKLAQLYLKNYDVRTIPSDDDSNPFIVALRGTLDEDEVRKIKDRVRNTRLYRFKQGLFVGKMPYGYKWNEKKKIVEVDKKKADVVRNVFQKTAEGIGYKKICSQYGLKPQSYYNIIRNRAYLGYVQFEGKITKGTHIPLINQEVFEKINGQKSI